MRQTNKCDSVRNDEIINLHLGSGADPDDDRPDGGRGCVRLVQRDIAQCCQMTC